MKRSSMPSLPASAASAGPSFAHTLCSQCLRKLQPRRSLSTTAILSTRQRRKLFQWLNGPGAAFKKPLSGSTNYLNAYDANGGLLRAHGAKPYMQPERKQEFPRESADDLMPFPLNKFFRSQPVLSEAFKDEIYRRVVQERQDIRAVSADMNVEMRRVAAVVRLKAVEEEMVNQGKPLATPYARAVLDMLPQTPYNPKSRNPVPLTHEPINDLNVHQATMRQVFLPTAESRHFTRSDAARAFDPTLLPADDRIPHPEMIQDEKWLKEGYQGDQVVQMKRMRREEDGKRKAEMEAKRRQREEKMVSRKETGRWEYRFRDVSVQAVGRDGRGEKGVGVRYGWPLEDRKKSVVKIPKRVD